MDINLYRLAIVKQKFVIKKNTIHCRKESIAKNYRK